MKYIDLRCKNCHYYYLTLDLIGDLNDQKLQFKNAIIEIGFCNWYNCDCTEIKYCDVKITEGDLLRKRLERDNMFRKKGVVLKCPP